MSAFRVHYPGKAIRLDHLGPQAASTGEMHGSLATPVPGCKHDPDILARRIVRAATSKALRA